MKPEDIKLDDWQRILLGPVPPEFYIELIIRGLLIYALLMVSMRLLGKRMAGQVSRLEMIALVSLASAIGVPLLSPMHGILPAFIISAVIVGMVKVVAVVSAKNEKIETMTMGELDTLVLDGVIQQKTMTKVRVTRERLFAHLRSQRMNQLGKVKRVYIEPKGAFTLVPNEKEQPGLLLLPDWDESFIKEKLRTTNITICQECGERQPMSNNNGDTVCSNCGSSRWTKAMVEHPKPNGA